MEINALIIVEITVIILIVYFQIKYGIELKAKIDQYAEFLPHKKFFSVDNINITHKLLKEGDLDEIKQFIQYEGEFEESECANQVEISLINFNTSSGTYFDQIINSLNVYLLKNGGGIADFSIVKDLVERNVGVEEEDIRESINRPLYLGLMATLVGIILGLLSLFSQINSTSTDSTLQLGDFLIAVCIAMVSSCLGLFITTFTGLGLFKNAKRRVEHAKNDFYNFVQTELLPVVSNDFGSSISRLNQSMQVFNVDLSSNINSLSNLFQKNYDTLKIQDSILHRLENLNAHEFLQMNATVLKRLESATEKFDRFNLFVDSLNNRLTETKEVSLALNSLMNRVNNFEEIAVKLDSRVEQSNRIIDSVDKHFSSIEKFERQNTQMFGVIADNMEDTLRLLSDNINSKYTKIMQQIDQENDLLLSAYREKKTKFDKLDLLDNLEKLNFLSELSKLDVLFEMKDYIDIHNNQEKEGLNKMESLENLLLDIKTYKEQKTKSNIDNKEILFAISKVHDSIDDFNNRGVLKKIFGGK